MHAIDRRHGVHVSLDLNRRDFLAVNIAAGAAMLAPTRIDQRLTQREQLTLLAVARTIFPHPQVPDRGYLRAIAGIERKCRRNGGLFTSVAGGLAALEWSCGGRFCVISDDARRELLLTIRDTDFYHSVYIELLNGLYGTADMWSLFAGAPA